LYGVLEETELQDFQDVRDFCFNLPMTLRALFPEAECRVAPHSN